MTVGEKKSVGVPDSVALLLFFVFWYAGNALYNGVSASPRAKRCCAGARRIWFERI